MNKLTIIALNKSIEIRIRKTWDVNEIENCLDWKRLCKSIKNKRSKSIVV